MERTSAASAMDWSIQLQKRLRSHLPGKPIEAIEEIGRHLERWNSEPKLTFAEYKIFGLIPGEDKLFLNAIFLRVADAFRSGNKQIKNCVVRIFLRMKRRQRNGDGEGILSKEYLENYLELLSRVKEVFDKGAAEERALALLLLGCMASLAKDCPDMRYIVLSSLVSGDALEVKAAYFAAGCFSEISDDFANVFLEILSTTGLSTEIPKDIKLAAARAFAKMWCSFPIAENAYKIEVLTLFQSEDRSMHLQATSLKCVRFILARGVCKSPSTTGIVHKLFDMLHKSKLHPTLQPESLRILYEIILINLSIIPCMEIPEIFQKLLVVVENVLQSSMRSNRVLSVSILADLSGKLLGRQDMWSGGSGYTVASQLITFVFDQVLSLVTPKVGTNQSDFAMELEVKSLLKIFLNLVGKYSDLHCLVLNNACLFVCKFTKVMDNAMESEKTTLSNPEMAEYVSREKTLVESKIILALSKIMAACLENLEYADTEIICTLDEMKLQIEKVCRCNYIDSYTRLMNILLLHLRSAFIGMKNLIEDLTSPGNNHISGSSLSHVGPILEFDNHILGCAKEMFERNNYWCAYKAGKNSACQGVWSSAAFIFMHLVKSVKSPLCCGWLKCLAQFSTSENQILPFLLSGQDTLQGNGLREIGVGALKITSCKYMENLLRCCEAILCAEEILGAPDMGYIFSFQRWFLTLRAKALKKVADMMKLLDSFAYIQDRTASGGETDRGTLHPHRTCALGPLINSSMEISCHMKKLAKEFDLLLTSFMGMDRQSVMSVSALALSCSIMAFTAGFAFQVPDWYSSEYNGVSESGYREGHLHAFIEDLLGRLKHIDCKTRKNLLILLKPFRNSKMYSSSKFRSQTSYYDTVILHKLCEYSVEEILSLRNEAAKMQRETDALYQILNRGSQVLMNVISKLMSIPFHTPHHFFRVRSAVSSELFVMNEDGQLLDGSSVLLGSPLSLSLSFQLKNIPVDLPALLCKVHCILSCKPRSLITTIGDSKWQARLRKQEDEIDDAMELNEKLLRYASSSVESRGQHLIKREDECSKVTEYACFELNEHGQGFSTCFLDTSILPVGDYRITWHSSYVDSGGSYWSLLPINAGPLITVQNEKVVY